jgi:hypothetical protein
MKSYWSKASNWSQGLKDKDPRPKSGKLKVNLHGTYFRGKINWLKETSAKRRAPDLENQESG